MYEIRIYQYEYDHGYKSGTPPIAVMRVDAEAVSIALMILEALRFGYPNTHNIVLSRVTGVQMRDHIESVWGVRS